MKKLALLLFIILIGSSIFAANTLIENHVEQWLHEITEDELLRKAQDVAEVLDLNYANNNIDPLNIDQLNSFISRFSVHSPYRINIIQQDGAVLADSWLTTNQVHQLENHAQRPEIMAASTNSYGLAVRFSDTIQENLMYLAIPYKNENLNAYIRVAISVKNIEKYITELNGILLVVGSKSLATVIIIIGIAIFYLHRISVVYQTRLEQRVEERTTEISRMQQFGQMLSACESLDELSHVVSNNAESIIGPSIGAFAITHASLDKIEVVSTWGSEWPGLHVYSPNDCWAFRRGRYNVSEKTEIGLNCKHLDAPDAIVCIPLQSQGLLLGSLHIGLKKSDVSKYDKQKILAFTEHVSLSLSNINLCNKLEQQALRDPLTNLYNRRYLDEALSREIKRSKRKKVSVGVMMIDIDYFKKFNDSFGHNAGDYILQKVGKVLASVIREEDIACRYGGEEFTLIISESELDTVVKRAEELLNEIREMKPEFNNRTLGYITASIGIAMFPEHGDEPQQLLKIADQALYNAKANGRDQICIATMDRETDKNTTAISLT